MRLIGLYEWIAGSQHDFTRQFQNNENLFHQAQSFWNNLNGTIWYIIIVWIAIGILGAYLYFGPYNNTQGRHYKLTHWLMFIVLTVISTIAVVLILELLIVGTPLKGTLNVETMVSLGSGLYALGVFLLASFIWCGWGTTNAYRFLKFWK